MLACGEREAMLMAPPLRVTQHSRLTSVAAQPPSTGISHHRHLPPPSPPSHPLDPSLHSQQQPLPWDCSTIPKFQLPATALWGMYGCGKDWLILIPFRLPQISCFPLRLKCFSSDSDNSPDVGIELLPQFPHWQRAGPVLLILLFFPLVPSSYRVSRGSIYSFPLVRYSCLLSAGVLHALLCLKVYS